MSQDLLILLANAVDALTRPSIHREPTSEWINGEWRRSSHDTEVPPLLDQLRDAVEPSSSGEGGRSVPGSRAAARLDSIVTLIRIEAAAGMWLVNRCGQPLRNTVEDNLRGLVGYAPTLDNTSLWDLTDAARRWVTWARVVTGWEVPPFRPANTCPLCAARGSLRVRLGDGVSSQDASALCVECAESWDAGTIGLLAEHIRAENQDEPASGAA